MNLVLIQPGDDVSLQAITHARSLGGPVHALIVGSDEGASELGGDVVHVARHDGLTGFAPDAHARICADVADRIGATAILAAGTERGNDLMARVAARIGEALAANCIAVTPGQPLALTRIRWGGSLLEEARLHCGRAVLTVAPHVVATDPAGSPGSVSDVAADLDDADLVVMVRDRVAAAGGGVSLADAKVVVTGGRGVGSADGFAPIEELAGLLGAAVGCSRAVTMAGWRPHTDQVGQTGTKISPDLYIPCGISGATQHMAGCKGAKHLLAINSDPEAPIMASADYAVIGDVLEIVPAISAELRKVRGT